MRWKNYDSTMHTLWHKSDANPYPPGIKNTPASKDFLAGALAFLLLHVRMQDGKIRLPVAGERQRPLTKTEGRVVLLADFPTPPEQSSAP